MKSPGVDRLRLARANKRPYLDPAWLLSALAIAAVCTYYTWRVLSAPSDLYPGGIDTMGHLTKVYSLAARWCQGATSDWFPEWYMGATAVQYYPPLSIWVSAPVQMATDNVLVTFKIVTWSCLFLGGLSATFLARRLGADAASATIGGVFYCTSNYTLFSVFVDGTLGRAFSLPLYPLLLWSFICLVEKPKRSTWITSCELVLGLVLCHAMHAYLLFLTAALFMLIWCLRDGLWLSRVVRLAEVAVVGILLSAFWAIPGATQLETPGVPWSPPEMAGIRTVTLSTFLDPRSPYGSTGISVLAVLGITILVRGADSRRLGLSLAASSFITLSLVYGPKNPIYNLLPMKSSLAPLRFMNAVSLPLALSAAFFVTACFSWLKAKAWPNTRFLFLISGSALALVGMFSNTPVVLPAPTDYPAITSLVDRIPDNREDPFTSGRVAEELPRQGGEAAFIPVSKGYQITAGWNIEGTPHLYTLQDHNVAYANDNVDYVLRNWYLWNVRAALIDTRYADMIQAMTQQGWKKIAIASRIALMTLDRESSYITYLSSESIVIGRSSFYFCSLFPAVTQGREANPLKYDDAYLANYRCIVLYDIPATDNSVLEKKIVSWVKQGKNVIIDLSVSDTVGDLLGVSHRDVVLPPTLTLTPTAKGSALYGAPVQLSLMDGRGAVYDGLDSTLLTATVDGEKLAICGVREMDAGRVIFVGGHLARLVSQTGKEQVQQVLGRLLQVGNPEAWTNPQRFDALNVQWSAWGTRFEYETDTASAVVLSVTYTPRWHAYVDGVPQRVYPHENLVLMNLPAGRHSVEFRYGTTWVTSFGWATTALALAYAVLRLLRFAENRHVPGRSPKEA